MSQAHPKRAMAIVAHPDDIEFMMAGTLLLLGKAGYELHYLNIANGCCGTNQFDRETIVAMRRQEAMAAATVLGARYHESLTNDLEIFYDHATLRHVASAIRKVGPEILLVHSPHDYMEDHVNACRLAVTAAFARGMPNYPVDPPQAAVGKDVTVYHAQPHGNRDDLRQLVMPDFYVDIESVIETKSKALACHQSQKKWLDESQGMDSYLQFMQTLAENLGRMSGKVRFAEGWRRHNHLGFCAESADPLGDAIAPFVVPAV
jgi:N-acetylglucosamine malate deacetylase 1